MKKVIMTILGGMGPSDPKPPQPRRERTPNPAVPLGSSKTAEEIAQEVRDQFEQDAQYDIRSRVA